MKRAANWFAGVGLAIAVSGGALAADLGATYRASYCPYYSASDILSYAEPEIKGMIETFLSEAEAELASTSVLNSTKPSFVWASETKFACNVALSYFRTGNLDDESVQKCDCFHTRMTNYR